MKRFFQSLLVLAAIVAACIIMNPTKAQAATTDLAFTLNDDGESYSVSCGGYSPFFGDLVLPASYNGKPVTHIKDSGFLACTINTLTIPDSIVSIGNGAFRWCDGLTSVSIPNSVVTIGDSAFYYCSGLRNVTIGDSVTAIGDSAFASCYNLTSVTIPDSVTTIGNSAFYSCDSLTSVTIGDSVTTIGDYAFQDCTSLTSVTIPDSVITIGSFAFQGCYSLKDLTLSNGLTAISDSAFADCSALKTITIPDSITAIGDNAFSYCYDLTNVTIPNSVTTIGNTAFSHCDGLTSIIIPDSVTIIGNSPFLGCSNLTDVVVSANNPNYSSDAQGVLYNKNKTMLIQVPRSIDSYTIPSSVTIVGNAAFWGCYNLDEIIIPVGVTIIGNSAFYYCSSLINVTIPTSVISIGDGAFQMNRNLTDVYYLGTLGQWNAIYSGYLAEGVLHYIVCCEDKGGTEEIIPAKEPSAAETGLTEGKKCSVCGAILVPQKEVPHLLTFKLNDDGQGYSVTECNTTASGVLEIPATYNGLPVTVIGYQAFYNCQKLTTIIIPEGVSRISGCAFEGCCALTRVSVPDSIQYVHEMAFVGADNLKYTVCDGGRYQGNANNPYALLCGSAGKVEELKIHPNTKATREMLYFCYDASKVIIPAGLKVIGAYTFPQDYGDPGVDIYYTGTPEQWKGIIIGNGNNGLGYPQFLDHCEVYGHSENVIPSQAPSCTESGLSEGKGCVTCGEVYIDQEEIPAIGHTEQIIPGKKATCSKSGLTDGKICSVCETVLQAQEIIPAGKHNEVTIPGEPATCTSSGISDGVGCEDCGEILVYPEEIPALGHNKVVVLGYAATCTETGLTDGEVCSACGKVYVKQSEIYATGHTEGIIPGKTPTCTETGLTEGKKCTVCNEILVAQVVIPTIAHTEEIIATKAPTCTETGLTEGKKCSACGKILLTQETISATGHTEEIIPGYAATCTEAGLRDGKKCSVCGEVLLTQEIVPATGHIYDNEFDVSCNVCGDVRTVTGNYQFVNYRVVFSDEDETHNNHRAIIYKLGDKTVADPTDETALQAIDPNAVTKWGVGDINKILLTDAGNYVVLLKYNVGTSAAIKVPMVLNVSADPKLIIDKNNKITAIDDDPTNLYHRVVVYYLGDQTVENIYDEAALKAIDAEAKTVWNIRDINRIALTKGGNYVLHLCYNKTGSAKITVAQQFTVFAIPTVKVDINNKLVVTEENAENRNHRVTVFYLGEGTVEDPFDEVEVKDVAISSKTYWGIAAINKAELKEGGNYVIHLYYNVGTSEKRTLALDLYLNERPALSVDENGKISVSYTDPEINNPRAYIYNVGDADIVDIYNEAALNAISKPMQSWGLSSINKKQLTPGTYVIHLYYSVGTSAKKTVALKITI